MSDRVAIPSRAFDDRKVKNSHLRVLAAIDALGGGEVALSAMYGKTGIDVRELRRLIRDLETWGYLEVGRQDGGASSYRVLFTDGAGECGTPGTAVPRGCEDTPGPASPLGSPPKDPAPQNTPPYIPPTNLDGRKALESDFAEFWRAYPRKVKRPHALKAYLGARKKADAATILDGLERYKRTKPEYADWAHPTSWLNAERWADEADAPSSQGPPSSDSERSLWALRLFDFRSRRFWSSMWGPPPGEAGCRVPRDLLEEMAAA